MTAAIGMKGRGQGIQRIATHRAINPFMDAELRAAIENPRLVDDADASGGNLKSPQCYEATILLKICEAIQKAGEEGLLKTEQEQWKALERTRAEFGLPDLCQATPVWAKHFGIWRLSFAANKKRRPIS